MSGPSIPEAVLPLLTTNIVAVVATVRPDGQPATAHVWVDWDGEHLLFSSRVGSWKGRNLRSNPYVAVHLLDPASGAWLGVRGPVIETRPDDGLVFIDRLSQRYRGTEYAVRDLDREIFAVQPEHVRSSAG
jgi:PPOX class probable F420-dependent enzyme